MCKFNTGCPGHAGKDGFIPCSLSRGCATSAILIPLSDAVRLGMTREQVRGRLILSDDGKERLLVVAEGDFGDGWEPVPNDRNPPSFAIWKVCLESYADGQVWRIDWLAEFADRDVAEKLAKLVTDFDGDAGQIGVVVMEC